MQSRTLSFLILAAAVGSPSVKSLTDILATAPVLPHSAGTIDSPPGLRSALACHPNITQLELTDRATKAFFTVDLPLSGILSDVTDLLSCHVLNGILPSSAIHLNLRVLHTLLVDYPAIGHTGPDLLEAEAERILDNVTFTLGLNYSSSVVTRVRLLSLLNVHPQQINSEPIHIFDLTLKLFLRITMVEEARHSLNPNGALVLTNQNTPLGESRITTFFAPSEKACGALKYFVIRRSGTSPKEY